jgi:hypothetical protein
VGAKLPSSATTLTQREGWGSCCPRGNEAGAPRSGRNSCFISLLVATFGEPSYPRRQGRLPSEGGGAAAALMAAKRGLLIQDPISALDIFL